MRKTSDFLANSVCHFAALKANIFVSGCHGNHAFWGKIRLNILIMCRPKHILKVSRKFETVRAEQHLKFSGFYLELSLIFG